MAMKCMQLVNTLPAQCTGMREVRRTNERVLHLIRALSRTSGQVQRPGRNVHVVACAREQLHEAFKSRPIVPALADGAGDPDLCGIRDAL